MGKNKTRLQQNNTDLQAIKVTVEGLPTLPIPQVVTIDGVQHSEDLVFESKLADSELVVLPSTFQDRSAVVLDGEIHIIGSNSKTHYKFNGSSWVKVSTLPIDFKDGSAVVLNGEIHILGGSGNSKHYKFNGTSWTEVSTLPYTFRTSCAVVLDGEIHILGGPSGTNVDANGVKTHYKFNGVSWVQASTLPYAFNYGSAVVLNGEIHILGGINANVDTSGFVMHYKFNGASWTSVSRLPYNFYKGSAVVLNGEIHILGGGVSHEIDKYNYEGRITHFKFNGSSWVKVSSLPSTFLYGSAVVLNGEIHILGGYTDLRNRHYLIAITVYTLIQ